jgi:hypothetical protein
MSVDLLGEMQRLALGTTGMAIRRLVGLGVDRATLAGMGRHHFSLGVGKCLDLGGGTFCPSDDGRISLVLPVYEEGELVDLVALNTDAPHDTRLRVGDGWALGVEHGLDGYDWDEPLQLHISPLDWMKADCIGLCVLDWGSPKVALLRDYDSLALGDPRLKSLLHSAWSRSSRPHKLTSIQGYQNAA